MPVSPANASYGNQIDETGILIFKSQRVGGQQMDGAQAVTVYNAGDGNLYVHVNGFGAVSNETTSQKLPFDDPDIWLGEGPDFARVPPGTSMTFEVTDVNNGSQIDWIVVVSDGDGTQADWAVTKRK